MGKSDEQLKVKTKETPKSPISPMWIGTSMVRYLALTSSGAVSTLGPFRSKY